MGGVWVSLRFVSFLRAVLWWWPCCWFDGGRWYGLVAVKVPMTAIRMDGMVAMVAWGKCWFSTNCIPTLSETVVTDQIIRLRRKNWGTGLTKLKLN